MKIQVEVPDDFQPPSGKLEDWEFVYSTPHKGEQYRTDVKTWATAGCQMDLNWLIARPRKPAAPKPGKVKVRAWLVGLGNAVAVLYFDRPVRPYHDDGLHKRVAFATTWQNIHFGFTRVPDAGCMELVEVEADVLPPAETAKENT